MNNQACLSVIFGMLMLVGCGGGNGSNSNVESTPSVIEAGSAPQMTQEIELRVNLPAKASPLDVAQFDSEQSDSYTASIPVNFYDSIGGTHIATVYFVRDSTADNQWAMFLEIDHERTQLDDGTGAPVQFGSFVFGNDGALILTSLVPTFFTTLALGINAAVDPITGTIGPHYGWRDGPDQYQFITIDIANNLSTQLDFPFAIYYLSQDGFGIGRMSKGYVSQHY